jgi:hypothetical protein
VSSNINLSTRCATGIEIGPAAGGGFTLIGTIPNQPAIIIFDNQGAAAVAISTDGVNTWRTFPAGEALVLDLRAANGIAANFSFQAGTAFYTSGATTTFSISYIYAS